MAKLGVGIIGLGRRWRKRYRPALHALRDRYRIRAVYDGVRRRGERTARLLGCRAMVGAVELLERADIEAVLIFDAGWHGLWPLEAACQFNKPVYCAVPLDADAKHAEAVCRRVTEAKLAVMPALWPRFAPATVQLC